MPNLEISMVAPEVQRVGRGDATWLLCGCSSDDAARLERSGNEHDLIEQEICARAGDATIIKVIHGDGRAHRVSAWRGPTSVYEVFLLKIGNGDLLISDHFRNLLTRLPTSERIPSDDAIIDHFLFRTTPGHNTYCQKIARLGQGERSSIDLTSGQSNTSVYQKLDEASAPGSVSEYLDVIDRAFNGLLSPLKQGEDIVTLFSGGIDSTLLHSYLGPATTALNLVVDAKDGNAAMEAEYAKSAAGLLGANLHRQEVRQSEFLRDLELATENTAMPIFMGMLSVFSRAFSNDYERYISGWSADALFGCAARYNRVASVFANPILLRGLELIAPVVARKDKARRNVMRERLEKLLPAARKLSMGPDSMLGMGATSETYAEFDIAGRLFGEEAVTRRLEKRFEYLTERAVLKAPRGDNFFRHLEIYSLIDVFCGGYAPQLRHLGMASKKSVLLPYISGDVVRGALRIPVDERYIKGFEGKYILKKLLKRRLNRYPIGQRKGTTAVANFPQYYKTGPLSRIWDQYEVPDFIRGEARERIVSSPLNSTYSAIAYAIWKSRVLENQNLKALSPEQSCNWPY